ncbi:hypothetical protein QTP70_023202, partial [Hemibagrus guttatus]
MGGDHGHSKLPMPDYKTWKWEGTPLEFTQQRLARRGLKDPWARPGFDSQPLDAVPAPSLEKWEGCGRKGIRRKNLCQVVVRISRNEAWRYSFGAPVSFREVMMRGFRTGFIAFAVALAV